MNCDDPLSKQCPPPSKIISQNRIKLYNCYKQGNMSASKTMHVKLQHMKLVILKKSDVKIA